MQPLLLLLSFAVCFTAATNLAEVRAWTEQFRQAANNYCTKGGFDCNSFASKVPTNAAYRWVHKDPSNGRTYLCGGAGGVPTLKWILDYMYSQYEMKSITRGQPSGDDVAVWNIKTNKDTRKASIQAQFNGDKLVNYYIIYDHESPLA